MRQIVMTGPRRSKVIDVPIPEAGPNQLLVKVTYTGMCHSEWYPWATAKAGDVFGHESVGVVAKVGSAVKHFRPGDRVTGLGGGGYKEYIVMDENKAVHVPDNVRDEDALAEPLDCILSAAGKMMPELPGDRIAVVGCGYMGLGVLSLFKISGYLHIIAVDKRREALENAKKLGATECYTPEEVPPEYILNWQAIRKPDLTRDGHAADLFGIGLKKVMEFSGTPDGLELAGRMVCAHGRLGVGGYHNDALREVDFKLWNFKALDVLNCHERRIDYENSLSRRAMELLSSGLWKFTGMANHIYEMEDFDRANADMESHAGNFIKGLVRC